MIKENLNNGVLSERNLNHIPHAIYSLFTLNSLS